MAVRLKRHKIAQGVLTNPARNASNQLTSMKNPKHVEGKEQPPKSVLNDGHKYEEEGGWPISSPSPSHSPTDSVQSVYFVSISFNSKVLDIYENRPCPVI